MKDITTKAYAKINLTLDVLGKLEDGYHDMLMVMQTVSLCDELVISISSGSGQVSASTNRLYIPNDQRNVACKAASAIMKETGIADLDVKISIKKRIPVCAGMGGGSSDAAAVLRVLNNVLKADISEERLMQIAGEIGSDVPFCLMGGAALAEGRGDRLRKTPKLPDCHIVICKPNFSVSTPKLFSQLDCQKIKNRPDTDGILAALERGELSDAARRFFNIFEEVLPQRAAGVIDGIKGVMFGAGALGASMTGTGSAVFGVFDDENAAKASHDALKKDYREVFFANPV